MARNFIEAIIEGIATLALLLIGLASGALVALSGLIILLLGVTGLVKWSIVLPGVEITLKTGGIGAAMMFVGSLIMLPLAIKLRRST